MFEYEFTQENYPKKLDTTGFTDSPEDIKNEILESRSNFKHVDLHIQMALLWKWNSIPQNL